MMELSSDIMYVQGVGPKRAELLAKELNVHTVEEMLYCFPYKYIDRTRFYHISEISSDSSYIQVKAKLIELKTVDAGRNVRLEGVVADSTGSLKLVWFKGVNFMINSLKIGAVYVVFGKPSLFNGSYNIAHPEMSLVTDENQSPELSWQSSYNTSEKMKRTGLTSSVMRKIVFNALKMIAGRIPETLPSYIREPLSLMSLKESLFNVHFPSSLELLNKARERLKFEELFYIQLSILKQSKFSGHKDKGVVFNRIGDAFNEFYKHHLKFDLTGAQKRVLKEIRADVGSGNQMNRLVQGDVGSGKTLVALLSMLMAVDNGCQACMMAPTEILAIQHFNSISDMIDGMGLNIAVLTGSTKASERRSILAGLADGSLNLLIGTHALIEDVVQFKSLGLAVIDEQHRFGVAQRARLWNKSGGQQTPDVAPRLLPHVLVMTATPIPRTLAMTLYGDLDVSVIDEMPPGRKAIKTYHCYEEKRDELMLFLKKQIQAGRQVYIVYPLIEESEKTDLLAVEQGYDYVSTHLPMCKVSMVHGRMKPKEKDDEMQKFLRGETNIMVATTVIEVGVNVPNASVMVIESAQRFGLSQLHQLRGRVGRGAEQSYCILLTPYKMSADTKKRIETMVSTNDGFEIAEADMRLRGPGDIEGTMQSGTPFDLKIASLVSDGQLLALARETAAKILKNDPKLETPLNQMLRQQLHKKSKSLIDWSKIS